MSVINKRQLASMYSDKDADRYDNVREEALRLTNGPGGYVLQCEGIRYGVSKKPGNSYGKTYCAFEFTVRSACSIISGGQEHQPDLAVGDKVAHVLFPGGEMANKELTEIVASALGTQPVYKLQDGPHEGKLLIMVTPDDIDAAVDVEDFRDSSLFDADAGVGVSVSCIVRPRAGKGQHEGKTFFNCAWRPADEDGGIMDRFPSYAEMLAECGEESVQALITQQHG